jgi:hypothetical protein
MRDSGSPKWEYNGMTRHDAICNPKLPTQTKCNAASCNAICFGQEAKLPITDALVPQYWQQKPDCSIGYIPNFVRECTFPSFQS